MRNIFVDAWKSACSVHDLAVTFYSRFLYTSILGLICVLGIFDYRCVPDIIVAE